MTAYSDLLKHPNWQKKRLEIFQRDNWACRKCEDTTTELQIHHLYYLKDKLPWEYPDNALMTLCECCHKKAEFMKWLVKKAVEEMDKLGFPRNDVYEVQNVVRRTLADMENEAAKRYMNDIKALLTE